MKIPSAYGLYRVIFGYPEAEQNIRVAFGRAIADSLVVVKEVFDSKRIGAAMAYEDTQYARQLAVKFLTNFQGLIGTRPGKPLSSWGYMDGEIVLDSSLFPSSRKRGLKVRFPFVNTRDGEIVIPTFGPARNMARELSVLTTLVGLGNRPRIIPQTVEVVTYWDLLNKAESSLYMSEIAPADPSMVLAACSKLMDT